MGLELMLVFLGTLALVVTAMIKGKWDARADARLQEDARVTGVVYRAHREGLHQGFPDARCSSCRYAPYLMGVRFKVLEEK